MSLKNKRVLITAGPTWVAIDCVRALTNIATGRTGILLAEQLANLGAKVTLLLGPVPNVALLRRSSSGSRRGTEAKTTFGIESCCLSNKIKVIPFNFFDELKNAISRELRSKRYDILIHSAAVADYKPQKSYNYKIKSGLQHWKINLVPNTKIIDMIKKIKKEILLVGFKFEPQVTEDILLKRSKDLLVRANADFVVANTITSSNKYKAFIINQDRIYGPLFGKMILTERLIKIIGDKLCPH